MFDSLTRWPTSLFCFFFADDTPATFGYEGQRSSAEVDIDANLQVALQNNLNISLFIRTRKANGMIFYLGPRVQNGQLSQGSIMAKVYQGKLQVVLNGEAIDIFQDTSRLDDGYYHKIQVMFHIPQALRHFRFSVLFGNCIRYLIFFVGYFWKRLCGGFRERYVQLVSRTVWRKRS